MALKGSLEDFSIVNILQMIKLEGKTGRLTLSEDEDQVKITFDQGSIIYAEGTPQKDESRIESTLLANSIVKSEEWQSIKKEHEDKLKPYWEILSTKTTSQILTELISRQSIDTVYNALRWKKGTYEFAPMKSIKYNTKIMVPLDVDGLLMEGCRIADEWVRVTSSLPPLDTFVVKNIYGKGEEDESLNIKVGDAGSADYKSSLEYEILSARGVSLSDPEVAALAVTGSGKTIQGIMDAARQSHFASLEAIQSLLRLEVLKPSKKKEKAVVSADHTGSTPQLITTVILLAILLGGIFWQISSRPKTLAIKETGAVVVKTAEAMEGLKKIERAMKTYLTITNTTPVSLDDLVAEGTLPQSDLIDPWNNRYQIVFDQDRFALFSRGPDIMLTTDNIYLPAS